MLRQGREQREAHLTDATNEGLLLHLNTLVLQQVRGLAEDLHTLGALERAVLTHHALVLMGVGQVGDVMTTRPTFMASLTTDLQSWLLGLHRVLLSVLLQACVRLQDDPVHGAAQGVVGGLGKRVHHRGRSHRVLLLLLPRLRHPSAPDGASVSGDGDRRWSYGVGSELVLVQDRYRGG